MVRANADRLRQHSALCRAGDAPTAVPRPDLTPYLGQRVRVEIDRPLGSAHPRYPELRYLVNYGELPGTLGGDGQPIDAYVLGVAVPCSAFEGEVIAIIARADDVEDTLVVGAPGARFTRAAIAAAVAFQEQFFDSTVMMERAPDAG